MPAPWPMNLRSEIRTVADGVALAYERIDHLEPARRQSDG